MDLGRNGEAISHSLQSAREACVICVLLRIAVVRCEYWYLQSFTYLPLHFFQPEIQVVKQNVNCDTESHHVLETIYLVACELWLEVIAKHFQDAPEECCPLELRLGQQSINIGSMTTIQTLNPKVSSLSSLKLFTEKGMMWRHWVNAT